MNYLFYDTCALLEAQQTIFENNDKILISNITINELEDIKTSGKKDEETKYAARKLLHLLNQNEDKYEIILYKNTYNEIINEELNLPLTNDSKIIISAYVFQNNHKEDNITFITNDLACKTIAKSIGLNTIFQLDEDQDDYTGYIEIILDENEMADFYSNIRPNKINQYKLLHNQYLIIKDTNNKIVDKYKWDEVEGYIHIHFIKAESKFFGKVVPKGGDIYQQLALDTLTNNQISMLRGPAGTGKSFLAFGHMFSLLESGRIDKIIVFCNTVATKGSAKLGFYPGSRTEKLLDSQIGNLLESKLGDRFVVEKLIAEGKLVLLPMSDIRGYDTSGMNAAIYISEAQNLDIELMRLALQRIGEDSICILDGDSNAQVDLSMYAGRNNGMKRVSKIFRGSDVYGEVTLVNIHRSKIANLAQQL